MTTIESNIKSRYLFINKKRFCQGDILHNLEYSGIILKYGVVLTQECDLQQDYSSSLELEGNVLKNYDKFVNHILICPAYVSDLFCLGKHIDETKQMRTFNSAELTKIKKNDEQKRYHFLSGNDDLKLPELVLDFKNFITIPRDDLYSIYNEIYHCSINELFKDDLSHRFCNFLSRIGLPEFDV